MYLSAILAVVLLVPAPPKPVPISPCASMLAEITALEADIAAQKIVTDAAAVASQKAWDLVTMLRTKKPFSQALLDVATDAAIKVSQEYLDADAKLIALREKLAALLAKYSAAGC